MKKLMAILALAALLALGSAAGEQAIAVSQTGCVPAPSGLVSWWPGDGNASELVAGRDGVIVNNVTFVPGKVDQAFSFDGTNYVSVSDDPIWTLGFNPFTIELWVNFNVFPDRDPFIGHDEASGEFNKWIFWFDNDGHDNALSGNALRFHVNSPSITRMDSIWSFWNPSTHQWHHVAVTRDGTTYTLYIDGFVVATPGDFDGVGDFDGNIPNPDAPLTIGRAEIFFFNGLLDEVTIYNRALTASEIQAIFNAGSAGKCKVLEVPVDIKPESCPNPLNVKSQGVLPVAIVGTSTFDVTQVDPASVRLEGIAPLRSSLGDVATPFAPFTGKVDCDSDCTTAGADGLTDLSLKFDRQEVVAALGAVEDGECLVLKLTGNLLDGTDIVGEDVVIIKKKGK